MPTQAKAEKIDELMEKLGRSTITVLVQTQGLDVKEMGVLRQKMRDAQVEFHVAKNTLLRIASERNHWNELDTSIFNGQTSVAFGYEDEVAAVKAVADYVSNSRVAVLKAGIMGGRNLTAEQLERIAKIRGGKAQSKAEVVGTVQAPLATTVGLLSAPLRDLCYVFQARAEQLNSGQSAE
ncbi:MAG TPA: 50S ribosomal protein L10 [Ktedonobacteraceae bacterium]|jgi:large subunit ribosomal protein L10|nr:50S ribosomal protein L10 [Ktedonobacteraceae bacterium]